jgi:hypothetical protein
MYNHVVVFTTRHDAWVTKTHMRCIQNLASLYAARQSSASQIKPPLQPAMVANVLLNVTMHMLLQHGPGPALLLLFFPLQITKDDSA